MTFVLSVKRIVKISNISSFIVVKVKIYGLGLNNLYITKQIQTLFLILKTSILVCHVMYLTL